MKTFHILILLLSMVVAGCTEKAPVIPITLEDRSDAKVYYHEGCQYLKFDKGDAAHTYDLPAIHSETYSNHPKPVKLLSDLRY